MNQAAPARIKKIPLTELMPGMFVHDVDCHWHIHSPFRYHFKVANDAQVEQLRQIGAHDVYIDTTLGRDLPGAPTLDDARQAIEAEMQALAVAGAEAPQRPARDPGQAATYDAARRFIRALMSDFRLGRHVSVDEIGDSVEALADSALMSSAPLAPLGTVKSKDEYTFEHSLGVSTLLIGFCQTLKLGKEVTRQVGIGGVLHDVGKARVPLAILNKPGSLDRDEFAEVKRHVEYGMDMIGGAQWLSPISRDTLAQHHERYDGSGYPFGLKGGEISMYGQMAAIADVYDAITAERVYHKAVPPAEALRMLHEWSKSLFNAELMQHFIRSIGIYPLRTLVRLESGALAIVLEQNPQNLLRPRVRIIYDAHGYCAIAPRDLDLANSPDERIQGIEDPEQWGLDIGRYLFA